MNTRVSRDSGEEGIGDRVRRVRRDANANERRLERSHAVDLLAKLGQGAITLCWIGCENLLIHHAANAALLHGVERDTGIAGVAIRGNAVAKPVGDAIACRIEQRVSRQDGALGTR